MELIFLIIIITGAFGFGFFTQVIATSKGYEEKHFFWLGFFFGILALIFVIWMPPKRVNARPRDTPAATPPPPHSEVVDIHVSINGQTLGPYTRKQIRDLIAAGSISDDAMYWKEGMTDWQPVSFL